MVQSMRQEAKREQIRAAAATLFLARGFAATSMDAVTSSAGISKETLYRYYGSKADLFADVLGDLISDGEAASSDAPTPSIRSMSGLEAVLIAGSERYLARVIEPQQLALLRVVIAEGARFPELVQAFRSTLPASGGAMILGALEAGRKAGLVSESVDLRVAGRAFAGLLMMFIFRDGLLLPKPRRPDRRDVAQMVRIFVRGISNA